VPVDGLLRLSVAIALIAVSTIAGAAAQGDLAPRAMPSGRLAVQLGDLLVAPEEAVRLAEGKSIAFGNAWPGAVVYYEFNANVSAARRSLAMAAMAQWSEGTAIRLVESTTAGNRILVSDDPDNIGCGTSFLGMVGGVQDLKISCWDNRTIVHEFGHALGASHEHQRADRGGFVTLNDRDGLQGAYPGVWNANFGSRPGGSVNSAYDYASVMHYSSSGFFTIDGQSYGVTIAAVGAQPAGAPAGSAAACTSAPQCTSLMGRSNASARDLYGKALRYGRRLDRLDAHRPLRGSLQVSGFIDSCGGDCWRVPAETTVTITLTADPGHIAVLAGDCQARAVGSATCTLPTDRNRRFVALTIAPAPIAMLLETPPRPPEVFADGFE
jgi:hypothetical protein